MVGDGDLKELLDLQAEELSYKEIVELNNQNERTKAVYDDQFLRHVEAIKLLIESDEQLKKQVDVDKLDSELYVRKVYENLIIQFKEEKAQYNECLVAAKKELGK